MDFFEKTKIEKTQPSFFISIIFQILMCSAKPEIFVDKTQSVLLSQFYLHDPRKQIISKQQEKTLRRNNQCTKIIISSSSSNSFKKIVFNFFEYSYILYCLHTQKNNINKSLRNLPHKNLMATTFSLFLKSEKWTVYIYLVQHYL